jgi:hypothetical protein
MGQVAREAWHRAVAEIGWSQADWAVGFEASAAAVIAVHEAQRPAWPAMRPMSESMGPWAMIRLLDRDELGPRPVRIRLRRDTKAMWEDLLTGEWYSEAEILGWWPLPEVPR